MVLLTKARFTGSVQLLFNLPRSLKMSPTSRVWSSLLLCMFTLVVLKSQHGKKNIVILTHLVGNIKARGALKKRLQRRNSQFLRARSAEIEK